RAPTDLVIALHDARKHLRLAPLEPVLAGHPEEAARRVVPDGFAAPVARVEKKKSFARHVPGLRVGEIRFLNELEFINRIRFRAAMNVGRPARAVRRGKNPQETFAVNL